MGYSSASEGEIVQDKATRSRAPPARDSAIDRRSRPRSPPSRYNDRPRNNQHSNSSSSSNKRPYAHRSNQYPDQHTYSQHSDPHAYSRYPDERHSRYNQEPPEKRHRPQSTAANHSLCSSRLSMLLRPPSPTPSWPLPVLRCLRLPHLPSHFPSPTIKILQTPSMRIQTLLPH